MTQFIVTHIDGSKLNLHSRAKGTFVESAKFRNRWQSYAELTLEITAYKAPEWAYFDMLVVDETPVFLHEWNEAQHIDNKGTKYILHFYGIEKMLFEASPFLDIDSAGAYISKDKPPIVGNLELFGNVLCNCINYRAFNTTTGQRYKQDTIKLGTCPAGTKHLLVSTTEYNAFAALLAVCSAFKTHYTITINPAGDTDYLLNFGVAPGVYAPLAYGRGKGLYRLDRKSISNENVKTILTVLGSSKNLPQGYGKQRLELDETLYPGSIIADNDKIQTFGAWNDVYIAEDIMPEYRGEILGVDTEDKFTFYCELDDFDPTGGTLNMLTGNLAGSNFRIAAFNAASGKITVEELVDSSGFAVPSVAPYLFATGDTFTIVDIPMPQAYIEIAQQALAEAGQARYLEVSQPRVAYNVALHSRFVKSHGSRPRVGMYFPITDTRYGVNKAIQCITLERNLLAQDEYEYTNCEVADNVVETLGAKIYKQSKEAQALLKHLGATHLTTPTSSLQGTVRTAQAAAVAAAEAVAALEAEAARIAAEAYADGILSNEEAARIADVAAKLTEAKQYAAAQAAAAESAAKTYAEGQAAAAQAAAEAVAAAEAEAAELAANAYADGIVDAEEARAIAEAAAKLTEAKNHANTQAAAAEAAASTYAAAQAEAARLAAIASAKTYTDTEVTAAKGYADSTAAAAQSAAEAYALAKANLAETNAEAYADGVVDAEESARIADAQAKLNEAKTYAEQKATAAENAAKAYADTQLGNFATTVTGDISNLQSQIDGNITTWFYAYVPTTGNAPANTWTTTALKNQHIGDLFYVNNDSLEEDGFCYRWTGTAWELIKDTQITKALADAAEAKDTADSKRRVFVATPTTPYDIGDLWLKSGDLYKCKVARATGSYVASDWEKGVKYTDDTVANANLVTAKAYADTKKAEAIAAAEAAAEAEALAAQTAAEAHADGIVTAEEQARIADVNAKLATAKTYAETKASEAQTAAQQYAATAASNAQSAAESYALAKANLAETTAKAYADGIVDAEEARAIADATAKANAAKAAAEATAAALDAAIQVGGRNLLLNSKVPKTGTSYNIGYWTSSRDFIIGETLTVTIKGNIPGTKLFGLWFNGGSIGTGSIPKIKDGYYSKQLVVPAGTTNKAVGIYLIGNQTAGDNWEFKWIKLESGNKATDWTPAPEDVQAEIDAADAAAAAAQSTANAAATAAAAAQSTANAASTAATNAQTSANTANNLLSDIANDNKFTPLEKQETKKEWDAIVSEKTKIDSQATTFGVSKTAYGTAYTALSNYITPLLSSLTTTSNITGTTFRSTFKTYYDARTDLLNAIAAKARTLANTAQTTADAAAAAAAAAVTTAANDATNKANAAKAAARDDAAKAAGYSSYDDMVAKPDLTVNGLLNSQVINVNDLFANTAFITTLRTYDAFINYLLVKKLETDTDEDGWCVRIDAGDAVFSLPAVRFCRRVNGQIVETPMYLIADTIGGPEIYLTDGYGITEIKSGNFRLVDDLANKIGEYDAYGLTVYDKNNPTVILASIYSNGAEFKDTLTSRNTSYKTQGVSIPVPFTANSYNVLNQNGLSIPFEIPSGCVGYVKINNYGEVIYEATIGGVTRELLSITYNQSWDALQIKINGTITAYPADSVTVWKDAKGFLRIGAAVAYTAADVGAVPTSRKVNNKALSANITLSAADVGAVPTSRTVNGKALSANISLSASDVGAAASSHTHSYVPTSRKVNNKALSANITLSAADVGALASNAIQYFTQAQWDALSQAQKDAVPLAVVGE